MNRARALWHRLLGRSGEPEPDGHPTPAQLAAYHEDRLPPEKDKEIQEHFVECPECPELMLDLDRFASKEMPVLVVDDLSDTRVERAWLRLRKRLFSDVAVPRFPRPRWLWLERPAVAWGMVCALLLCSAGLGLWVQSLRLELRAQQEPQLSPPVAIVQAPAATRSASVLAKRAEFKVPQTPRFLLKLEPPEKAELPEYRLEIKTPLGRNVWASRGLTQDEDGLFVVSLAPDFLPEGEYDIYVFSAVPENGGLIQDYYVRFSYL